MTTGYGIVWVPEITTLSARELSAESGGAREFSGSILVFADGDAGWMDGVPACPGGS